MTTPGPADLDHVYAGARQHVGRSQTIEVGRLEPRDLQRFAVATGSTASEYFDLDAAGAAGYSELPAFPLYLTSVLGWGFGPHEEDLLADGNAGAPLGDVPLGNLRLMGGGQSLVFHEPAVAGMTVRMQLTVEDIVLKQGKSGPMLLLKILRRYVDELDRLLVECRETFIGR